MSAYGCELRFGFQANGTKKNRLATICDEPIFIRSCLATSCPEFELTNSGAACLNDMTLGVQVSMWINNWSWSSHWSSHRSRYWCTATRAASTWSVATRITAWSCVAAVVAFALENLSEQTTMFAFHATSAVAGWSSARIASSDFSATAWSAAWSCTTTGSARCHFSATAWACATCWSSAGAACCLSATAWCTS